MSRDYIDIAGDESIFSQVSEELLDEGKNIICKSDKLSKELCYMITPERKAYFLKKENNENEIEREFTKEEYELLGI